MVERIPLLGALLLPGMVLFASQAEAEPFGVVDAHSFSMGGTGVASGTRGNAAFYNPALLAAGEMPQNFSLHVPVLGARFYEKEKVLDDLDNYQYSGLEADFDEALADYTGGDLSAGQAVGDSAAILRRALINLADKPVEREFFGGVVVGIPHDTVGASLVISGRLLGGAKIDVTQNDLDELQRILNELSDPDVQLSTSESFNSSQMTSKLLGRGLVISEVGLALAHEAKIFGHGIAVGVTPKYRDVTSFDYLADLNTADLDVNLGKKEHNAFDVDIGAAKHYGNGWSTGIAINNLFGQKYETVRGHTIEVEPQARLAAAHSTPYTHVALDLDLNEVPSPGFDATSQYIAVGGELRVLESMQVRIGYRHNMSNTDTSIATTGLGFSGDWVQLDLAVGANEDEITFAAQMGFEF